MVWVSSTTKHSSHRKVMWPLITSADITFILMLMSDVKSSWSSWAGSACCSAIGYLRMKICAFLFLSLTCKHFNESSESCGMKSDLWSGCRPVTHEDTHLLTETVSAEEWGAYTLQQCAALMTLTPTRCFLTPQECVSWREGSPRSTSRHSTVFLMACKMFCCEKSSAAVQI